jgi:inosine-uridine nucleoside N-ribohydrolase
VRLWIDTDIGDDPDDAVALWCAARHEAVELVGVSTVAGDTAWRAEIARSYLPGSVEVVAGSPSAAQLAAAQAYLSIGPWTHAAALAAEHALPARMALMGGVLGPIRHRGEVVTVEHNVGSDPAAARQLLQGTGGLIVVPLDATSRIDLDDAQEAALVAAIPRLAEHLAEWRERAGPRPLVLHDPAALLVLAGEHLARIEARRLTVEDDGIMRASIDAPVQRVVAHLDADAVRARIRALAEGD